MKTKKYFFSFSFFLGTIGFGDLVPGDSVVGSSSQEKLVICSLYLLAGNCLNFIEC